MLHMHFLYKKIVTTLTLMKNATSNHILLSTSVLLCIPDSTIWRMFCKALPEFISPRQMPFLPTLTSDQKTMPWSESTARPTIRPCSYNSQSNLGNTDRRNWSISCLAYLPGFSGSSIPFYISLLLAYASWHDQLAKPSVALIMHHLNVHFSHMNMSTSHSSLYLDSCMHVSNMVHNHLFFTIVHISKFYALLSRTLPPI